jgi:hypothetical protein
MSNLNEIMGIMLFCSLAVSAWCFFSGLKMAYKVVIKLTFYLAIITAIVMSFEKV